jgi:hypothetical protein
MVPVKPDAHEQVKLFVPDNWQTPLFKHGLLVQAFEDIWQLVPE